jgi:hypothetical protein
MRRLQIALFTMMYCILLAPACNNKKDEQSTDPTSAKEFPTQIKNNPAHPPGGKKPPPD